MDERWEGQPGVRVFEIKYTNSSHIVELDTIHNCNQSFTIEHSTGKYSNCGAGSKSHGDWDEVETADEFVDLLIDSGYSEITKRA